MAPTLGLPAQHVRCDHADTGNLRDRQVDEDDATIEDLHAQWHMRGEHEYAGHESRPDYANVK